MLSGKIIRVICYYFLLNAYNKYFVSLKCVCLKDLSYLVVGFIKRGSICSTVRSRKKHFSNNQSENNHFRFLSVTNNMSLIPPRSGVTLLICETYIITQLM
jgi:hypothetical protein